MESKKMGRIVVAAIVSAWVIPISILLNRIVTEPYMDELFHIPQAQRYCRGDFKSWDPMITTPPGLYYLSLAYITTLYPGAWLTKAAESLSDLCSDAALRSTDGLLAITCSILVYDILLHLRPSLGAKNSAVYAIVVALYPLNWFYTFLYYTDVASVTAVLAMYLASLKRCYFISALTYYGYFIPLKLGILATLCRQTNIVWMLFVAVDGAIRFAEDFHVKDNKPMAEEKVFQNGNGNRLSSPSSLRKRRMGRHSNDIKQPPSQVRKNSGLIDEMLDLCSKLWSLKWKFFLNFTPFVLVLGMFAAFVLWNGGIVLGAKEQHVVSLHFAQMMYFGLASAAAAAPLHFNPNQLSKVYQALLVNKIFGFLQVAVSLTIGLIVVHHFSIVHPYVLADNRHYTFYFWRKVIQAHWTVKYLLVPLYTYSWFSVVNILGKTQKKTWMLTFIVATGAVLVPSPLIEFRYYTVPIYFILLNSQIDSTFNLLAIGSLYLFVNIFTMAMFLFRTFQWDHEPGGIQRFMW